MKPTLTGLAVSLSLVLAAQSASAQTSAEPPPPPPLWDAQVGASFVGTSGNSDTAATGADFSAHRRGEIWQIESAANAVRTSADDETTAERYLGTLRAQRKLKTVVGWSTGIRLERDRFAGLDARSILDTGLSWALVHRAEWTVDGVTSIAWLHESRGNDADVNHPIGVLQLLSRIPFGSAGDTTQRFTYYPDFTTASAYRSEAEITAQAAMTAHLALKFAYLLRYSNDPVPGFKSTDNTTTASVVLRWKATTAAR
jgi:putative salt-induced outer membrane protein YdiY